MANGPTYIVVAPLAMIDVVDTPPHDGSAEWCYTVMQGGPVPDNVTPECLARLLDRRIVRPGTFKGGLSGADQ